MAGKILTDKGAKRLVFGMHSALINGIVTHDIPSVTVYVEDENELASFSGEPVGTFAITYGLTAMYQLKPDGTWAIVFERTE